jgi:hypothetical protein
VVPRQKLRGGELDCVRRVFANQVERHRILPHTPGVTVISEVVERVPRQTRRAYSDAKVANRDAL